METFTLTLKVTTDADPSDVLEALQSVGRELPSTLEAMGAWTRSTPDDVEESACVESVD